MLHRKYRLTRKKDFEILFKDGKFFAGRFVHMQMWKIDPDKYPRRVFDLNETRFGFVVSKKVSKRAVDRNLIKRRMRESVRLYIKDTAVRGGYLIAFLATPRAMAASYADIVGEITTHLRRVTIK